MFKRKEKCNVITNHTKLKIDNASSQKMIVKLTALHNTTL